MTLARRVAVLETVLSPTELVLRLLDEAHAFGDLESYVRSLLAESSPEGPLDRLCREAEHGARAGLRGKRREVIDAAVRSAVRETVFRFELVMRINVMAHDLLEREALVNMALAAQIALLTCQDRAARRRDTTYRDRLATRRDLLLLRVNELHVAQEARAIVEERYLAGHGALFPEAVRAWAEQLKSTEALADVAVCFGELNGVPPAVPADPDIVAARAAELVADLVEPAKVTSLDMLGEGERALRIATSWLRPKLELLGLSPGAPG
jgi:hypothetical protein